MSASLALATWPVLIAVAVLAVLVLAGAGWWQARAAARRARAEAVVPDALLVVDIESRSHGGLTVAPLLGLRGIIDAVVDVPGVGLVPLEHKPLRGVGARPYDSEVSQVAAESMLLEEAHGLSPRPFGLLVLGSAPHRVPLTDAVRRTVRRHIAAIRAFRPSSPPPRSHAHVGRCRGCGMRAHCDVALG